MSKSRCIPAHLTPAGTPGIAGHTPLIKPSQVSIYVFLEFGEIPVIIPELWVLKGKIRNISLAHF
jgi:hypothetical protein